ncbi:MAG: hypothetical protein ACREP1_01165 [Rhodanobacteraceae bacterium]
MQTVEHVVQHAREIANFILRRRIREPLVKIRSGNLFCLNGDRSYRGDGAMGDPPAAGAHHDNDQRQRQEVSQNQLPEGFTRLFGVFPERENDSGIFENPKSQGAPVPFQFVELAFGRAWKHPLVFQVRRAIENASGRVVNLDIVKSLRLIEERFNAARIPPVHTFLFDAGEEIVCLRRDLVIEIFLHFIAEIPGRSGAKKQQRSRHDAN